LKHESETTKISDVLPVREQQLREAGAISAERISLAGISLLVEGSPREPPKSQVRIGEQSDVLSMLKSRGACKGLNPGLFYSYNELDIEVAKQICKRCSVSAECLAYALKTKEIFGVWGGTSENERRRMLNIRRLV
jgi:WhiB family redox-sensing transcriptional regulator